LISAGFITAGPEPKQALRKKQKQKTTAYGTLSLIVARNLLSSVLDPHEILVSVQIQILEICTSQKTDPDPTMTFKR
jgi:hypothetical protein